MKRGIIGFLIVAAIVGAAIGTYHIVSAGQPLPGALWTTLPNGIPVDKNVGYESKCDVAINGGPDEQQGHLPDGTYDAAVTDPSGGTILGQGFGVVTITNGQGTFGPISLCDLVTPVPYGDTSNPGCENKAWLCVAGSLYDDNMCKKDNFKICPEHTPTPTPPCPPSPTPVPPTDTPVQPTPTETPAPPTATPTNTLVPPTATNTNTPVSPTATDTKTPIPPTLTSTFTPTNTPVTPTATASPTSTVIPTKPTPTNTPVTSTAIPTSTPRKHRRKTATPTATVAPPAATNTPITSTPTRVSELGPPSMIVKPTPQALPSTGDGGRREYNNVADLSIAAVALLIAGYAAIALMRRKSQ